MKQPFRRKLAAFRLDQEIIEALQRVKDRVGVPVSEQVRRALVDWLVKQEEWSPLPGEARSRPRALRPSRKAR
jgi:hypothetical protein